VRIRGYFSKLKGCVVSVAGEMNRETAETMSLPRCGVRDKVGYASDSRSKRYALQGMGSWTNSM
jgi:hypothetical protein